MPLRLHVGESWSTHITMSGSDRNSGDVALLEAVRDGEARYRFLAENIPVQIWTALPDGRLDYVTEQTARHFGLDAKQLLEDGWQNVLHPDDVALAVEKWTHALTTGEPYEVEFRLKLANGSYACHLARAVAQRDANGEIVRWFGTNTNIEEQREEQRRIKALLDEVGLQLREAEITITALQQAKAKAEERRDALDRDRSSKR